VVALLVLIVQRDPIAGLATNSMGDINREEFFQDISEAISNWEEEELVALINKGLADGLTAVEIAQDTLFPALKEAYQGHEARDLSFPELLMIAYTIKAALDVLIPKIRASLPKGQSKGRVVIGTIEGDIHDLGKNLVAAIFESGGYDVMDLGRDVPITEFVRVAEEQRADIIAASILMTPNLTGMEKLMAEIKARKLKVKTIIGGYATSLEFAQEIGTDAWAEDAMDGLRQLNRLVNL
jgi:methanogenic corrinoid protein MtbC1